MMRSYQRSRTTGFRLIAAITAMILLALSAAWTAAADETVKSIGFAGIDNTLSMYVDDKQQISAVAELSGGTYKDVTFEAVWSTSNSSVVQVDKGLLTAKASGYADITVKYSTVSKTMRVTVTHEYDKVEIATSGGSPVAPTLDVVLGEDLELTLLAYKNGSSSDVTGDAEWSTSSEAIAGVDGGKVEPAAPGTVTITARYKGRTDSVKLNVTSPYESLALAPSELIELRYGDAGVQMTATAALNGGASQDVTAQASWQSADPSVATVKNGLVKPAGVGTTTVRADYLGVHGTVTVVVRPAHAALRLSADKPLHLIQGSNPVQLQVFAADDPDEPEIDVTALAEWKSSNVYAVTISGGLLTAKEEGNARITASYKGRTVGVDVTVYPHVKSISIDKDAIDGFEDGEGALPGVTGETLGGQSVDVSGLAEWSSANSAIVAVEDGKWFARGLGETVLTARVGTRTAQVKITVHEEPLALLSDAEELTVVAGRTIPLPDVRLILKNGNTVEDIEPKLEWTASSPNILVTGAELKGLLTGRYTLTANYLGKKLTFRVTVEQEIVRLEASPASIGLNPGKTKSLRVTGYYKNGKSVTLTSKVAWTSSNPSVVTVSGSKVKAEAPGQASVYAEYQGIQTIVQVSVTPKLTKLYASSKSLELAPGGTGQVRLTAVFDKTAETDVTALAAWSSSNERVAVVSNGQITAREQGTATIKASYGGKTVSIRVKVKNGM
jgi:Bacterial Ig-like domain (group 2).